MKSPKDNDEPGIRTGKGKAGSTEQEAGDVEDREDADNDCEDEDIEEDSDAEEDEDPNEY